MKLFNKYKKIKTVNKWESEWFEDEKLKIEGDKTGKIKRKRRYLHFDSRISKLSEERVKKIFNPEVIERHSFYPFIRYNKKRRGYKRNPEGQRVEVAYKPRPILYASHRDALIYSWYGFLILKIYEEELRKNNLWECVIAYRSFKIKKEDPGKNNIDFAVEVFEFIKQQSRKEDLVAICVDVKGFFDSLDHGKLKNKWVYLWEGFDKRNKKRLPTDHFKVFKSITNFNYIYYKDIKRHAGISIEEAKKRGRLCKDAKEFREKFKKGKKDLRIVRKNHQDQGIPQGSPMSGILSNIYMLDFDKDLKKYADSVDGLYRRYSDDIMLVVPIDKKKEAEYKIEEYMSREFLNINPDKTEICVFSPKKKYSYNIENDKQKPLQYLGVEFNGQSEYIRSSTYGRFEKKLSLAVKHKRYWALKHNKGIIPQGKLYKRFTKDKKESPKEQKLNINSYFSMARRKINSPAIKKQIAEERTRHKINKKIRK